MQSRKRKKAMGSCYYKMLEMGGEKVCYHSNVKRFPDAINHAVK